MSKADKLLKRVEFYEKMASSQKPENDDLLKKASLFEKLALYSDRKSFLQAVAQTPVTIDKGTFAGTFGNDARQQLEGISADFGAMGIRDPGITGPVSTALNTLSGVDKDGLLRALQAAVAKYPQDGSRSGQLQNLQSLIAKLSGPSATPEQQDDAAGGEHMNFKADPVKDQIRAWPPINPKDQEAVFTFAVRDGGLQSNPEKQKGDGLLGPETRKALEAVKNYFAKANPQNPRMTDQQAITAAKFQGR